MWVSALTILLQILALWASFFVVYQLALAISYFLTKDKKAEDVPPQKKFAIIIPAHDEELMIGGTLESWRRVTYPAGMFTVYVIADNCTDNTSRIASSHGAVVLERTDDERKGKGHALAWALEHAVLRSYDAVVIADADATVCPEFLLVMNERLMDGAKIVQGYDGVMNPNENAMTRVMQITNVIKNLLYNHAKSKLGLSVQLMGTGMCFDRSTLLQIGWKAFSKGEDGEQFAHVALAGVRVEFEPRAVVYAHEASSLGHAYTQRIRWVSGRMQLVGVGLRLLAIGLRKMDWHLIDASLTFLIPNYVELANATLLAFALTVAVDVPGRMLLLGWFGALLAGQVMYFFLGVGLSHPSWSLIRDLTFVPVFLAWRLFINVVALFHVNRHDWVRAARVRSAITPKGVL